MVVGHGKRPGPAGVEECRCEEDDPMTHDVVSKSMPAAPITSRTRPPANQEGSPPGGLIRDLEEMRTTVLHRLSAIEELARHRLDAPAAEISRLEQALAQQIEELERERGRLRAHAEQDQASGRQVLVQLEDDRRLLAEAWEKLELERIDACSSRSPLAVQHPRSTDSAHAHAAATPRVSVGSDPDNPVAETILRQFQTLCNDVRRTTEARCSAR
jgi:hypothetical protein